MKRLIIGVLLGWFLFPLSADIIGAVADKTKNKYCTTRRECFGKNGKFKEYKKNHPLISSINSYFLVPGIGLFTPLTNRCKHPQNIEYFECNYFQIKLNQLLY